MPSVEGCTNNVATICSQARPLDKVGEFKLFHVPRNGLFLIQPQGAKAQRGGGGLNEKRVASRHKDTSYLVFSPDIPERPRRFYRHVP